MTEKEALETAKAELSHAIYLSECGATAGVRAIYDKKSDWLSKVIYLAEQGIERSIDDAE